MGDTQFKFRTLMLDDIKKSVNEIIYERTTSPLFGTLIVSWLIWNWRIIYLTFFISESKIKQNKIDYILANYSDLEHIVIFPLISTLALLTIIPFISNGAYWLSLKFNKWKVDQKNSIDKKQLLTIEQSIELREEVAKQEANFLKLVENKNAEITQLNSTIEEYRTRQSPREYSFGSPKVSEDEIVEMVNKIKSDPQRLKDYDMIVKLVQGNYKIADRSDISPKTIAFLESNDVIESVTGGVYKFTGFGKSILKIMSN